MLYCLGGGHELLSASTVAILSILNADKSNPTEHSTWIYLKQHITWFQRNSETTIISCSVYSITDFYKVIWNKHQEVGIVYEFTEKAYQEYSSLDFEVTQTMNDAWEHGEADFKVKLLLKRDNDIVF